MSDGTPCISSQQSNCHLSYNTVGRSASSRVPHPPHTLRMNADEATVCSMDAREPCPAHKHYIPPSQHTAALMTVASSSNALLTHAQPCLEHMQLLPSLITITSVMHAHTKLLSCATTSSACSTYNVTAKAFACCPNTSIECPNILYIPAQQQLQYKTFASSMPELKALACTFPVPLPLLGWIAQLWQTLAS